MPGPSNLTIRTFQTADAEPLSALMRESLASGELAGHTSNDVESIIGSFAVLRHLHVAVFDNEPVGLISPVHRFILVRTDVRRRGIGRALVDAAEADGSNSPDGPVVLFPPYNNPGALAFLHAIDFRYDHSLWRLQLDPERSLELPPLSPELALTGYRDTDLLQYVDLINSAFLDHPVPLHVTQEQIEHTHSSPNFDPEAIALIRTADGVMVGFSVASVDRQQIPPMGTINLLGVQREFRGMGLGRYLLIKGIERLRALGIEQIELAVEAENDQAMNLYRSVGFDPVEEWPQWMRAS